MQPQIDPEQIRIPFAAEPARGGLQVLDLYAGMGGLSLGFQTSGFSVTGVDREEVASAVFETNGIGKLLVRNLHTEMVVQDVPVVVGGPPCRPWSSVNVKRRGTEHQDHALLERFFLHLFEIRPAVFLMENVPPLGGDAEYDRLLREMRWRGYSISSAVLRYSDFGAATTRRRLFTVGFRNSARWDASEFFNRLVGAHRPARTVRQAIEWLRDSERCEVADHEWSEVRTIERYAERYRTGQYGWKQLGWDQPAPSFGSIAKTYILHPSAGEGTFPLRVLSVREVLCIMGFDHEFRFPEGTALHTRYRMVANSISPVVARACADVIREMLLG